MAVTSLLADPPLPEPSIDWEHFYANYRKPGFVAGYQIGHKLGGGVFGIVFKVRKESIGKAYAIKFLKVDDAGVREQILRELETVKLFAQVDHPNLVSIEDQGTADGVPYIVMGFAGDETLEDRLAERRLEVDEALQVFVQVLRGVHALHERSLIHFDLKPANIFLKGDVARVGDYGLSKLVTESCKSLSMGRGTPYYMAPEMLHRRGDHRSDIYSLGVILFECLSGEVPFTGASEWEVLKGHEEREVVFPAAIPRRLRPILARMLAKAPDDRFQSLAEVLEALRAPGALGESFAFAYGGGRSPRRPGRGPAAARSTRDKAGAIDAALPARQKTPGARPLAALSGAGIGVVFVSWLLFAGGRGGSRQPAVALIWVFATAAIGVVYFLRSRRRRRAASGAGRGATPGLGPRGRHRGQNRALVLILCLSTLCALGLLAHANTRGASVVDAPGGFEASMPLRVESSR